MTLQWHEVESSNLKRLAYDADEQVLHVTFKNGGHFSYAHVPQDKWEQLMAESSKGSYFAKHIVKDHAATHVEE